MKSKKIFLHYDMDAFFASVEQRDNPELKGIPIAVGYGVVTTASYEARVYGVKSAMSAVEAKRLCPDLKFVTIRKNYYGQVGRQIQNLILKITEKCEFTSIDEGYVDITEFIAKNSREELEKFIDRFRNYIYRNTRLTCSVGIGFSKVSAKIASDINKPSGHYIFYNREHFLDYIHDKELAVIPGIGKKTRESLALFNIKKVSDLYKMEKNELTEKFGESRGEYLYNVIRGLQFSGIDNSRKRQSYGHEITFSQAVNDITGIDNELMRQAKKLSDRLEKSKEYAKTVTLKVRYSNFSTYTKSKTLSFATREWEKIYRASKENFETLKQKDDIRLIGIHLSSITKSSVVQLKLL